MHTLLEPGEKGFLLTDIGRLIHRVFEQKMTDFGYSRTQWQTLAYLSQNPGITQVKLAHLMEIEPITLSRHLDRMEREGLLERSGDLRDRRVKRLNLTEQAGPQLEKIRNVRDEVVHILFKDITFEDETLVRKLLENVRRNLIESS